MTINAAVSKQGEDVLSGTLTPNQYIMNGTLNTFKIIEQGTVTGTLVPNSFSEQSVILPHGQDDIPFVYAFAKFRGDGVSLPTGGHARTLGNPLGVVNYWARSSTMYIDGTNAYFNFVYGGSLSGSATVDVSYFIVESPAS